MTDNPTGPSTGREYDGGVDPTAAEEKVRGWGPDEHVPPLTADQARRLQEHDEPVAAANFGAALTGDLGRAEAADEATEGTDGGTDGDPQTRRPDTSLGHEGGVRYRAHERGN